MSVRRIAAMFRERALDGGISGETGEGSGASLSARSDTNPYGTGLSPFVAGPD